MLLQDLCEQPGGIQTGPFGSQLHSADYVDEGTPIITVEHLGENRILDVSVPRVSIEDAGRLARFRLRCGDIVFSRVGSVDRRSLVREKEEGWLFSGRCLRVRPDPRRIDPSYLSYYFGQPAFKEHMRSVAVGATMPSLNTKLLGGVKITFPDDLAEQRRIAHILGTLDDKIELNRRMNETLEAMARALFKSWFVDFDPVRAKAESRDPGLPPHLADLFPSRLVDSPLGPIPEGWEVRVLGDLLSLDKGLSYKGQFLGGEGVPMVGLGSFLGQGRLDATTLRGYSGDFKRRHVVRSGDLLIANTDITQKRVVLGSPGIVPPGQSTDEYLFSHHVYAARFADGQQYWKPFVFHALLGEGFRARASGFATGTTVLALPREAVLGLPFAAPPDLLARAFARTVAEIGLRTQAATRETGVLGRLRASLLPALMSGI
jgi:type I restriction enzyme S subunit